MKFLLPHHFKKIGFVIAPIGFFLWLCMQWGLVTRLLFFAFRENAGVLNNPYSIVIIITWAFSLVSFFSFLGGIYFITFSKEKIEDEMIQQTRLESFQFAALAQIVFIIIGFLSMFVFKEPKDGGLMLFFISIIFLFWLCFIGRFNYILHIKIKG